MNCTSSGFSNPQHALFCNDCGNPLAVGIHYRSNGAPLHAERVVRELDS